MAPTTEHHLSRNSDRADPGESTVTGLTVQGVLPAGLSGRLLGVGPCSDAEGSVVHSVHLDGGRFVSYRNRRVGTATVVTNIIHFGGAILALGDGSPAYELNPDLDTLRRVDLAGLSRGLAASPKRDPLTGDLHLLAVATEEAQAHVVVSSGSLTRASRPIMDGPKPIRDLAITQDRVVFLADGVVGVATHEGEARVTWITTALDAPHPVHAHDADDTVVIYAITPSLERWTLHTASRTLRREVLDPSPKRFARTSEHLNGEPPRYLWTTGGETADKHDLATTSCTRHIFRPRRLPGDLVFVADETRRFEADGGWLVGFAHDASGYKTELVVLDAADIACPTIATVQIPRRIPLGLRSIWIPSIPPKDGSEQYGRTFRS
jgi:carotenoid cleavage dioxygenase